MPTGSTWPRAVASALLLVAVGATVAVSLVQNDLRLVYPLDDAYIHLAMASNFAEHGAWGVNDGAFSSSTSSPLWTMLLAATDAVIGVKTWIPLLLNVVAGVGVLAIVGRILRRERVGAGARLALLLATIAFVPLVPLVMSGMEHTLQVALALVFLDAATRRIVDVDHRGTGAVGLAVIAGLLVATRYEGVFLVAAACWLLLLRRQFLAVFEVGATSVAPVALYGAWSVANGWWFLPNSLLVKTRTADLHTLDGLARWLFVGDAQTYHLPRLVPLLGLLGLAALGRRASTASSVRLVLFGATALLHLLLAKVGWFYRYEAWLIALFVVTFGLAAHEAFEREGIRADVATLRRRPLLVAVVALALAPFAVRGAIALKETPEAMHDRYVEHVALASFVGRYYDDATVVANDIGTISYFTHARTLDLYGLGSREPVVFRDQADGYGADDVSRWADDAGAEIAVLNVEWDEVAPRIPHTWTEVATWHLPRNVVFKDLTLAFYAVEPDGVAPLADRLARFAAELPPGVRSVDRRVAAGVHRALPR